MKVSRLTYFQHESFSDKIRVSSMQSCQDTRIAADKSCCTSHYNTCFPSVHLLGKQWISVCIFMHSPVNVFWHYANPFYVFEITAEHQEAQCFPLRRLGDCDLSEVTKSIFNFGQKWIFKLVHDDRLAERVEESWVISKQKLVIPFLLLGCITSCNKIY